MTGHAGVLKGRVGKFSWIRLGLVLAGGGAVAVGILVGAATLLTAQYDGRILPGVRVGTVDIGGLDPAAARDHVEQAYSGLAQGTVVIATPSGTATLTYSGLGRAVDLDETIGAALAAGRSGDPLSPVFGVLTAVERPQIPVAVKVDHAALSAKLDEVAKERDTSATDAYVVAADPFRVVRASSGTVIDTQALSAALLERLHDPSTPSTLSIRAPSGNVAAARTDGEAARAADEASAMAAADLAVTVGEKRFRLTAARIRSLITFGALPDGVYGPRIDTSTLRSDVAAFAKQVNVPAISAKFVLGGQGRPTGVTGGTRGAALDVDRTLQAIEATLAARRSGGEMLPSVAGVVTAVDPALTAETARGYLAKMQRVSSWTVKFYPDISNGYGANIRIPARNIDGTLVMPGEIFSFFNAVGPIDEAHGFKQGGVIKNGKSYPTGAIGGGICSASTTMFNAALRAGFEIVERQAHYYFIDRYPIGLDATVFSDGNTTVDLRWKNDSAYPILIRGYADYGSITFELWTVPDGRRVAPIPANPPIWNVVKATSSVQYVTTLPPGVRVQQEYPHDGYDTIVGRTVYDAAGTVIHSDSFRSHYGKVDGLLLIGAAR